MKFDFLALISLLLLGVASAELTFEQLHVSKTAKPEDKVLAFEYSFTNTTNEVVTVGKIDAGCSCLKVKGLEKKVYQPGETGRIELDFALGTFTGKVDKTVFLWYEGVKTKAPSLVLRATVTIPVLFEIKPSTIKWPVSGEPEMKVLSVKAFGDEAVNISNIVCTNPNFKVELVTKKSGFDYEFEVTPLDTSKVGFGIIKFETDSEVPRFKRGQAFMVISKALKK